MIGERKTLLLVFVFFLRLLLESMVEFTLLGVCLRCDISYASNKTPAPPRRARFCPRPAERDPLPPARLARASPLAVARSAPGRDARPGGSRWPATTTMTRRCVSPRVRDPARVPPTRRQFTHHHRPPADGRAAGRGPRRGARATRSTGIARSSRIGARRRAAPTPATFAVVRSRASFARDRGRRRAVARPRRAIDAHSRPSRTFRFFRLPRALPITLSPLESRPLTPSSLSSVVFHRSRRSAASWTRRSVRRTRARSSTGSSASSA